MATNPYVNKVVLGNDVLLDLTGDTAEAADVAAGKTLHLGTGAPAVGTASYAAAPENNGNAVTANGILLGYVDDTSTATDFTATVEGLDALYDGVAVMLHNGVVTSASGFVLNVNSLGDKPVYNNLATGNDITPTNPTRDTTIFNINYTMLFVYDSQLVDGGAWICYAPTASSTAPSMDGTAAAGASSDYARADHVHPTDTSRQATLVSGTNIKTINNQSILGMGNISVSANIPVASASTLGGIKVGSGLSVASDGTLSASGGVSMATATATLTTGGWSSNAQTVSVSGVTASNNVIVAPAPASISAWTAAGVYCSAQGAGTLTFTCTTAPTAALTANVLILS